MNFTIPNIYFVIAIGLLTTYLTFLTTKGSLTHNSFKGIMRKLTRRGKIVALILFGILGVLVFQEINNQKLSNNKDLVLKKEQDKRDSTITEGIKKGVDSASNKLFDNISLAFSKQELRIDTLNKTIINLKSLNKTTNNYIIDEDPIITIANDGIFWQKTGPSPHFRAKIKSLNAGSTNFNVYAYLLTEYKNGSFNVDIANILPYTLKISTEVGVPLKLENAEKLKGFYLYLRGSYTNLSGSKTYSIDDLFHYNNNKIGTYIITGSERVRILKIINDKR